MNVIVFGGSGFLGSHVADALSEAGHQVTIYDIRKSDYLRQNQQMVVGDILDEKKVDESVKGKDIIYNFAGIADIDEASKNPVETIKYNILGNTILLESAIRHKVKRFVYASTVYVFSDSGSFYRCSKAACENYIDVYRKQHGLDYTILRYGTLYGTRADARNSVCRFITQAMREKKITYPGDGSEIREYINVLDAAKASVEILSDEFRNEHVIFTGYYPMKVRELFIMIKEMLKGDIEFEFVPQTSTDPMGHYAITPYTFIPKVGKKYVKHYYTDMGQGLLLCMQEVFDKIQKGKQLQ
ncbi:MAG: NAD-dependent epimerase [Nitrospirae bacterium GWB2_47_37]|nr:MAG: NAD-dependent epimerase [Nitrospirae bacterium GWB2_47_37]HAK89637.1 NAD-dependent epimerase [Nitrospiraceae bacterium]